VARPTTTEAAEAEREARHAKLALQGEQLARLIQPGELWCLRRCPRLDCRRLSGAVVRVDGVHPTNDPAFSIAYVTTMGRGGVTVLLHDFDRRVEGLALW
jgi:hypothetical protein